MAKFETAAPACLRCPGTRLARLPTPTAEVFFFECPSCLRQYAQKPNGPLTYRWLHPTSLALYGVMLKEDPVPQAERISQELLRSQSTDQVVQITNEIELELQQPTQNVRDILDSRATEETCRQFLAAVVTHLKKACQGIGK